MEIDYNLLAQAVTVVFGFLTLYFGAQFNSARGIAKELSEAISVTTQAINKGTLTADDLKAVVKEWTDVLDILRSLKTLKIPKLKGG